MTRRKKIKRKHKKNCEQKKAFENKQKAYNFLNHFFNKNPFMRVYKCPFCKKWHLTSCGKTLKILDLFEKLKK